jgi:hypothetical protein
MYIHIADNIIASSYDHINNSIKKHKALGDIPQLQK